MKKIELDSPNLSEIENEKIMQCLKSNYVSTVGPFVPEFEKKFAGYVGTEHAVSTQSGTAAIHMALHELGIKSGDEVIVPALTFIASINPIIYVGAIPVFVDIDKKTWNIAKNTGYGSADPDSADRRKMKKRRKSTKSLNIWTHVKETRWKANSEKGREDTHWN